MSEQHKNQNVSKQDQAPNSNQGAQARAANANGWKKLLANKWAYPAIYMAAAAIILSVIWVYQGNDTEVDNPSDGLAVEGPVTDNPLTQPVMVPQEETMQWPVADESLMSVVMPFYDKNGTQEEKAAAMVQSGDMLFPSVGVSLAMEDDSVFDVTAAMSGTVTRVETMPLVGNQVEITHSDGMKTVYQSLGSISVQKDDQVKQGDVIGQAGRNELEKDLGVHVHFEVHENDEPVNPNDYLPALGQAAPEQTEAADDTEATEDKDASEDKDATEETDAEETN